VWRLALHGRPHKRIPAPDADSPTFQRYQARHDARLLAIAQVHALHHSGLSLRAVAKQTGLDRTTVRKYIREPVPDLDADLAPAAAEEATPLYLIVAPPPAPWTSWAQVRQVGEDLTASRFLLLRRPDHLTQEEQAHLDGVLASPLGADLRVARSFLEDWYAFWHDDYGQRRAWVDAQARYLRWQATTAYHTLPPLARVLTIMDESRFRRVSPFLRHATWEATSNGAERAGRAFRHLQGPHFNLRSAASVEQALAATAIVQLDALKASADPPPNRSTRGRRTKVMALQKAAA
jgi:lambda repressor-like predicted transcriptional regulator